MKKLVVKEVVSGKVSTQNKTFSRRMLTFKRKSAPIP